MRSFRDAATISWCPAVHVYAIYVTRFDSSIQILYAHPGYQAMRRKRTLFVRLHTRQDALSYSTKRRCTLLAQALAAGRSTQRTTSVLIATRLIDTWNMRSPFGPSTSNTVRDVRHSSCSDVTRYHEIKCTDAASISCFESPYAHWSELIFRRNMFV